jgi:hypothetical protein
MIRHGHRLMPIAMLILGLVAVMPARGASTPAAADDLGIHVTGVTQATSFGDMDRMLDSVRSLGGRSVRLDISWQAVEWSTNKWNFTGFDYLVRAARTRGIDVDFILDYNNPIYGGAWNDLPANLPAWDRYVAHVVERYRLRVRSYEVWNEADLPDFNRRYGEPGRYLDLLKRSSAVIRRIDPGAIVLMTSLSRAKRANPTFWDQIAARAQPYFDVANLHIYDLSVRSRVDYLRRLNPHKPIWATEAGVPAIDEAKQASFFRDVVPMLRAAGVEAIFACNWRDHAKSVDSAPFGLLRADGSKRPAAFVFKQLATSSAP